MRLCYIGLGSNLGDRLANIGAGLEALEEMAQLLDRSSVYESEAWGLKDQPDFLNAVALIATDLTPLRLLRALKRVEARFHRDAVRWGPRELDLDILLYQGVRVKTTVLEIPHRFILERPFVLVPLVELFHRGWPNLGLDPSRGLVKEAVL